MSQPLDPSQCSSAAQLTAPFPDPDTQVAIASGSSPMPRIPWAQASSGVREKSRAFSSGATSQSFRRISSTSCPGPQPA
jgi:hypothetical protein